MEMTPKEDSFEIPEVTLPKQRSTRKYLVTGSLVGIFCGIVLAFTLSYTLLHKSFKISTKSSTPSSNVFQKASVATDSGMCSTIGKQMLVKGGNAADAAVAAMFCVGLGNSHSAGIGGGHLTVYFDSKKQETKFVNAREAAPLMAHKDMFRNSSLSSTLGGSSIAVPGEVAGLWQLHQQYGKLQWQQLLAPIIELCEVGYPVSNALAKAINISATQIRNSSFNMGIFLNEDGTLKKKGDWLKRPQLASTFRRISEEGGNTFYRGSLADDVILDLQDAQSIINHQDLIHYHALINNTVQSSVRDVTIQSAGLPGSGAVLCLILNILDGYNMSVADMKSNKVLTYHRIIEAFRFAYAKRSALGDDRDNATITELVANMTSDWFADDIRSRISDSQTFPVEYYDPAFELPDDHGTTHLSIVDEDGNAVAMTSTINTYFGSKVRGKRTGIIFNNEMDDFSTPHSVNYFGVPASPSNFVKPGSRPLSSMSPTVVLKRENGKDMVRLVAGASGGTLITTATALVIANSLWFEKTMEESIEMPRLHDQLMPNKTFFESGFDPDILEGLRSLGHEIAPSRFSSVVQGIRVCDDNYLDAACDSLKGGYPDGY